MAELSFPASVPTLTGGPVHLIASDIDGTILSYTHTESGTVSTRTIEAFQAAQAAGVRVVLVTGRPVRWLRHISETLGPLGTVIASNGAVTYDLAGDQVLHETALEASSLFTVKDMIREIDPQASFAAETLAHLHLEERFIAGSLFFEKSRQRAVGITEEELRMGPLDETLERDSFSQTSRTFGDGAAGGHVSSRVVKLMCKTETMAPDEFLGRVQHEVGDLVTVTHSAPGVSLLELSAQGVNKAAGLARYAAAHRIERDRVVAFGDMPNDIEMLRWAGTSWAVGSAHPMARSAADHTAASCDEDGVAQVIEKLLAGEL